jgi:ubiquinone/menaquinone biosynthesis C-methylase UbiE
MLYPPLLAFVRRAPFLALLWLTSAWPLTISAEPPAASSAYTYKTTPDPDGIGKVYHGREIAQVMGHAGAAWLERAEREREERTDLLLDSLPLKPGQVVADIGAGTGYFASRLARRIHPGGRVLAVDIQPEMLAVLTNNMAQAGVTNVFPVLGTIRDPGLSANSVDLVLMVDVYHEFEFPREMMQAICRALKPNGQVVLVEYRAEDPNVPIKPLHKMSAAQVRREMADLPLKWVSLISTLPRQHILVFQNSAEKTNN